MEGDVRSRLELCFRAVFPAFTEPLENASAESLPDWDSVQHVTLISLVEEEFGLSIDPGDTERLASFSTLLDYVQRAQA